LTVIDTDTMHQGIDSCQYLGDTWPMSTPVADDATDVCPIEAVSCCSPLVITPLAAEDAVGLAAVLKAIADPARLRVISLLAAQTGGEACVNDLTDSLGLSQPTVSHHLKTLVETGLVRREKRGVWAYFSLVPGALDGVARLLSTARTADVTSARSS
jgi:ArsR family transcriptional regulator